MQLAHTIALSTTLTLTASCLAAPPDGFEDLVARDLSNCWGVDTVDPRSYMDLPADELEAKKAASRADIEKHWAWDGDELVNDGHGLFLTTDRLYGDFELLIEYRTVPLADSGIYLRGIPQVQIWDTTEPGGKWHIGADKGSGGLWNNSPGAPGKDPTALADKPFGEWNAFRIVMVGERVTVFLNDTRIVDHATLENYFDRAIPVPAEGPIQLQTHGGEIRWRNAYVRDIGADEANEILRRGGVDVDTAPAYEALFNGRDLTGWAGATDHYEIVDGAIQCKSGHGGNLYTEGVYDDFVVRFEVLLPPGGNNGLAIRYPGSGDTAYVGMCELQVLDNTHPKFANLDPRQYHASAYGMVPAHRGYMRPAGTWNFQEVRVKGSTIRVELNGTVILDTDLATAKDFMYDAERFAGRTRTSGHFGFAGHNDPVRYRNVEIRRLTDE